MFFPTKYFPNIGILLRIHLLAFTDRLRVGSNVVCSNGIVTALLHIQVFAIKMQGERISSIRIQDLGENLRRAIPL